MKTQIAFVLALLITHPSHAQDIKGARDFDGIPRFQGAKIIGYQALPFDAFRLPTGPVEQDERYQWQLPNALDLEGKITGYVYAINAGTSTLAVFRNYQTALNKAGFEAIFVCDSDRTCGDAGVLVQHVYADSHVMSNGGNRSAQAGIYGGEIRYLAAKHTLDDNTYLSLAIAREVNMAGSDKDTISVVMHVIEKKPLEQTMVVVDAAKMASDISATGHVALYGIYFDFNSADIKPESDPALDQIATLMKQSQRKVAIVGHTDTVGGFDSNMSLSGRRAKAVVDALVRRYNIPAARLHAAGVGYLSPVASNETDEGRAKNRRVELVQE